MLWKSTHRWNLSPVVFMSKYARCNCCLEKYRSWNNHAYSTATYLKLSRGVTAHLPLQRLWRIVEDHEDHLDFSTAKLSQQALFRWPSCQRKLISSRPGAEQCARRFFMSQCLKKGCSWRQYGNKPSKIVDHPSVLVARFIDWAVLY